MPCADSFNDIHEIKCGQAEEKLEAGGDEKLIFNFIWPYSVLVYPLLSRCLTVALAKVVNAAGALIRIVIMNRPPACPRLSDERGNSESYWSGLRDKRCTCSLTLKFFHYLPI